MAVQIRRQALSLCPFFLSFTNSVEPRHDNDRQQRHKQTDRGGRTFFTAGDMVSSLDGPRLCVSEAGKGPGDGCGSCQIWQMAEELKTLIDSKV